MGKCVDGLGHYYIERQLGKAMRTHIHWKTDKIIDNLADRRLIDKRISLKKV